MKNCIAVASLAFALAAPGLAHAQFRDRQMPCGGCPIALEQAMRALQGAKSFFQSGEPDQDNRYLDWPPAKSCDEDQNGDNEDAPPFPPDGYYDGDLCDPRRASELVADLADKVRMGGFGTAFLDDGDSLPSTLNGAGPTPIDYNTLTDELPTEITPENYCDAFEKIWDILNKLKVIDVSYAPGREETVELWGKGLTITDGGAFGVCAGCMPTCFESVGQGYGAFRGYVMSPPNCSGTNPPPKGFGELPYTQGGWSFQDIGIHETELYFGSPEQPEQSCIDCSDPAHPLPVHWETAGLRHVYAGSIRESAGPARGSGAYYIRTAPAPNGITNDPPTGADDTLHKWGSFDGPTHWERKLGYQDPHFTVLEPGDMPPGVGTFGWQVSGPAVPLFRPDFDHRPDRAARAGAGCSTCEVGRVDSTVDGVNVRISLGKWELGDTGYLLIRGDTLVGGGDEIFTGALQGQDPSPPNVGLGDGAAEMGTPKSLFLRGRPRSNYSDGFGAIKVAGALRQVVSRNVLADIITTGAHTYEVRVYKGVFTSTMANGLYDVSTATLEKKVTVAHSMSAQPLGNDDYDVTGRLTVTEIVDGTEIRKTEYRQTVTATDWTKVVNDEANSNVPIWRGRLPNSTAWVRNERWDLASGPGTGAATRHEAVAHSSSDGVRTELRTVRNDSDELVSWDKEYFTQMPWGEARTQLDVQTEEGIRTTHWTWDSLKPRLVQIIRPDGKWERYTYDVHGRKTKVVSQYLDSAASQVDDSFHHVVEYTYSTIALFGAQDSVPEEIVGETEKILGHEIARKYTIYWYPDPPAVGDHGNANYRDTTEIRCATLGEPSNLKDFLEAVLRQDQDYRKHWMSHERRWATSTSDRPVGSLAASYDSSGILTVHDNVSFGAGQYEFDESGRVSKTTRGPIASDLFPLLAQGPDQLAVRDGTVSTSLFSKEGTQILSFEQDLQGTPGDASDDIVVSLSRVIERNDVYGRATKAQHLDGLTDGTAYDLCCGVTSQVDRDGVPTTYVYDEHRRVKEQTRGIGGAAITTRYTYDAEGRVKTVTRVGSDNTAMLQRTNVYDTSGRLLSETDALGRLTMHHQFTDEQTGHRVHETTLPDPDGNGPESAPVRDEVYYQDGQLLEVTGTAVHPVRHQYGVELDSTLNGGTFVRFSKEIKVGDGNSETEWVKSYIDPLDRPYKTVYADGAASMQVYNDRGEVTKQVDADGRITLFRHGVNHEDATGLPGDNADWQGEWSLTAADMNADGNWDFDGADRITKWRSFVTHTTHENTSVDVRRAIQTVWTTEGNAAATSVESTTDTSLDGLRSWTTALGLQSSSATEYDPVNRTVTATHTEADGTRGVRITKDGRVDSQATYLAPPGNSKHTEIKYSYDAHGRNTALTDTRATESTDDDRVTSIEYNAGDQVVSTTSPPPDATTPGQHRVNLYDGLGRVTQVTLPDSTVVHASYFPTGEVKKAYGSRTYPVEYTYDSQGRVKTLKTWQDFDETTGSGNAGSATTTWNYESQRGWLTSKAYNDGNGPSYTYWPSGRLKRRTWSQGRNITTDYSYDNAGAPSLIDYSDTTPDISYTYDRRGRLVGVTDAVGARTLSYNDSGQLLVEDFTSGVLDPVRVENHYDGLLRRDSNKLFVSNALRNQVDFAYETVTPRLWKVTKDGNDSAEYAYVPHSDLVGTLTVKHNGTFVGSEIKSYDNLDRLTLISASDAPNTSYPLFAYALNIADQRTRVDVGDGSYWLYNYDAMGQLTSAKRYFVHAGGDIPVPGQQFEYAYDDIGNRLQTKAGGNSSGTGLRTASYTPNQLNQYQSRDVPGSVDIMGYAPNASVTVSNQGNNYSPYRFEAYFQQLLSWVNTAIAKFEEVQIVVDPGSGETRLVFVPKTPEQFAYDSDGNLLSDGRWNYSWDGENHLVAMETKAGLPANLPLTRLEFVYDYMGRRNIKRVYRVNIPDVDPQPDGPTQDQGSGGMTQDEPEGNPEPGGSPTSPTPPSPIWTLQSTIEFVWDGWNLLADLDGTQASIRTYAWGLDISLTQQAAGGVGGLIFESDASLNQTLHPRFDASGNVRELRNSMGEPVAMYETGPSGESITNSLAYAAWNPFRFSTKYVDSETGLLYYGYRYYNPSVGRWASRDPSEEWGGLSPYSFVSNKSPNAVDFLGLWQRTGAWTGGWGKYNAKATAECGDTLYDLAMLVTANPIDVENLFSTNGTTDNAAEPGRVYDVSYLLELVERRIRDHVPGNAASFRSQFFGGKFSPSEANIRSYFDGSTGTSVDCKQAIMTILAKSLIDEIQPGEYDRLYFQNGGRPSPTLPFASHQVSDIAHIKIGDWVYFKNNDAYGFGNWKGENTLVVAHDSYWGFGEQPLTGVAHNEREWNKALLEALQAENKSKKWTLADIPGIRKDNVKFLDIAAIESDLFDLRNGGGK